MARLLEQQLSMVDQQIEEWNSVKESGRASADSVNTLISALGRLKQLNKVIQEDYVHEFKEQHAACDATVKGYNDLREQSIFSREIDNLIVSLAKVEYGLNTFGRDGKKNLDEQAAVSFINSIQEEARLIEEEYEKYYQDVKEVDSANVSRCKKLHDEQHAAYLDINWIESAIDSELASLDISNGRDASYGFFKYHATIKAEESSKECKDKNREFFDLGPRLKRDFLPINDFSTETHHPYYFSNEDVKKLQSYLSESKNIISKIKQGESVDVTKFSLEILNFCWEVGYRSQEDNYTNNQMKEYCAELSRIKKGLQSLINTRPSVRIEEKLMATQDLGRYIAGFGDSVPGAFKRIMKTYYKSWSKEILEYYEQNIKNSKDEKEIERWDKIIANLDQQKLSLSQKFSEGKEV